MKPITRRFAERSQSDKPKIIGSTPNLYDFPNKTRTNEDLDAYK